MPPTRRTAFLLSLLLLILLPAKVAGQDTAPGQTGDITLAAEPSPEQARPGEWIMVSFSFEIDEGWHMYALDSPAGKPLDIAFASLPDGLRLEEPLRQSPPTEKYDPNFQEDARFFDDEAQVRTGLQVSDSVEARRYDLEGTVTYMLCTDEMCLPPRTKSFALTVEIAPGEARTAHAEADWGNLVPAGASLESAEAASAPSQEEAGGLWAFLLLAAGAGLGALLMPCIFPMIPLTVSYFTKHAESRSGSLSRAAVYGLTIIVTFTGLGALAAAFLGAAGAQTVAANPWVNLGIAAMLVFFALSLLGLFELRLPSGLASFLNRQSDRRGGYTGAFFMGLTLTVVSFSCTAPFVGGLLAAAAQGSWLHPILGMLVFSGVLAVPFVGFALFPQALQTLPSSGQWMNALKVTFGFIELAAAIKFLSNADLVWGYGFISRELALALTITIFALAGLYLLGKLPMKHETAPQAVGVGRILGALAFLGTALYMLPGLWGAPLGRVDAYLPPHQATAATASPISVAEDATPVSALDWHDDDIEGAFQEAQQVGKPVFIDFTGYTCTNCREMEANVFPAPPVAGHLRQDFVLLRLYTDNSDNGAALQRYQSELTGTVALPTYAIVTPEERLVAQHSGMASPEAFGEFLQRGLDDARPALATR